MASGRSAASAVRVTVMAAVTGLAGLGCHPSYNSELMQASLRGDDVMVRDLLGQNANVVYTDHDGRTALHAAAENGHADVIKTLARQGKAPLDARDADGKTPLHYACENKQLEAVKALVAAGARVNVRDNDGWTPLHMAAAAESADMCTFLAEHGADANVLNGDAQTPVQVANENDEDDVSAGDKERTVAALRAHGAKD